MLRVDDLRAGYGSVGILRGVSLHVGAGEAVGVLGRNGVGKTTLMRALTGEIARTGGEVSWTGGGRASTWSRAHEAARAAIAYVPQGRAVFPALTVAENLAVGQAALSMPPGRVQDMLDLFPALAPLQDRLGGSLSGGQQQLLALARALVGRPRLLLLDEPSEGIQPSILDDIARTLDRLRRLDGFAILLVEQNLDFAAGLVGRAYLMDMGRMVREIPGHELQAKGVLSRELMGGIPA